MGIAVQYAEYGPPEVLEVIDVADPEPARGEVRLSVRAAGINPLDWKQRSGAVRDVMPVELPARPGIDVAGIIDAVGPGVSRFTVGDGVLGRALNGSYASAAIAAQSALALKPPSMTWGVAASLPVVLTTAAQTLATLRSTRGEVLVIDGASGAVGTFAVQLATRRGVTVIGTGSPASHARLHHLGAIPITHGPGLLQRVLTASNGARPVAALDAAGMGGLPDLVSAVGDAKRVVTLSDPAAFSLGAVFLGADDDVAHAEEPPTLDELAEQVAAGALVHPEVTAYPLRAAATAHADGEAKQLAGKAVLIP